MTIDEAIKHCEEVAEKYCEKVEEGLTADDFCDSCASEHRQLAEWLKELKAYREAREEIGCLPIVWEEGAGIRKCIDILDKHLMEVTADE